MAHAAYHLQQSLNSSQTVITKVNGQITNQQVLVKLGYRTADRAAASTNNPRRADGTRPMAPWSRGGGNNSGVRGLLIYKSGSVEQIYQGLLASPGPFPGSIVAPFPEGRAEALRSALGKFGESDVKLGIAMQEIRQTTDMVGKYYTNANQLTGKLVSAVNGSKRVRQQFRDFLKNGWRDVPSSYLEYLFGMAPLAGDVQNAMMVLQDTKETRGAMLLSLRGSFSRTDTFRSPSWYAPSAGALNGVTADFVVNQRDRAVLLFQLPDWYWDRLPPVTPFRQAWGTARLSFVADWIVPISSWLSGFEGLQLRPFFKEGSVSTKLERTVSGAYWSLPKWQFIPERAGGKDYSYSRAVLDSFPTEELFSLPRLNPVLGLSQLRVGSALLGQKMASLYKAISRS